MTNTTDTRQMDRIIDIYDPWLEADTERMMWTVTLTSGRTYQICCPLGAAVEIEEAGFKILAASN